MINKEFIKNQIVQAVEAVKKTNPMVGSITNSVTINLVANAQLAVGGAAAMVYLPDEGEFLARASGATYINVGTLLPIYEETLPRTAKALYEAEKPWVLDPVAVGIGELRTKLLMQFKEYKPSVIKGNASEIIALAGLWNLEGGIEESKVRGVDSTDAVSSARTAAVALAKCTGGAVFVSGETDLITDGSLVAFSHDIPNVYLDLSATFTTMAPTFAIKEYPERTFFSSDAPYCSPLTARTIIEQIVTDKHVLEQVLGGNIARLLQI
jgi:Hydroxyethylthiazole kinase, sugar kinase family